MKTIFVKKSGNSKTGPIPVTYSQRETCPPSCPHYGDDCYGEDYFVRMAWNKVPKTGIQWADLCEKVAALPAGQVWRHNVAGDLPGEGEAVDVKALQLLVKANIGRRGFTYSHKKSPQAVRAIRAANRAGFTVNLSADDAGEADKLAELKLGRSLQLCQLIRQKNLQRPRGGLLLSAQPRRATT